MAGTDSRFNAARFREGITFAMRMGFPEDTSKQITWQWDTDRTFSHADSGGEPLTWTSGQVASTTAVTDKIVNCAVKFNASSGTTVRVAGTALGNFDMTQLEVTLLDTDWDLLIAHGVTFPDQAVIDGNVYRVQFIGPPLGLFDVTIYQVYLNAVDET